MTLKEFLKDKDHVVSVGAAKGSSYMYIGRVRNQLEEDALRNEYDIYKKTRVFNLKNKRTRLKTHRARLEEKLSKAKEIGLNIYSEVILNKNNQELVKEINHLKNEISSLERAIESDIEYLENYTDPFDREVVDTIWSKIEDKNLRITIEGTESGWYWFESECQKNKKSGRGRLT